MLGRKAAEGARTSELLWDVTKNTVTSHPVVAVGMGSYATTTGLLNDDPDQIGEGMAAVSGSFSYARAIGNPAYSVNVRVRGLPPVPSHIARQRGAVSVPEINIRRINNQYSGKTPHTENVIGKNNPGYNKALQERITARGQAASGGKTGVGRQGQSSGKPNVEQRIVEHGGGNWLSTGKQVNRNTQETGRGNQNSRFKERSQTEREVRTGAESRTINPDRKRITRSEHAVIRSSDGRSVGTVVNDIQKARDADIFIQSDGRYVIRGQGAREHIIEANGIHITTVNGRSKASHNNILRNGGRRFATQEEINAIKSFVK